MYTPNSTNEALDVAEFLECNARRLTAFFLRHLSVKLSDGDDSLRDLWVILNKADVEYREDDQLLSYCFTVLRCLITKRSGEIKRRREADSRDVAEDAVANAADRKWYCRFPR